MRSLQHAQKPNALRNAQIYTLILGCILGMSAFGYGASLEMTNPIKQNLILVIGFSELIVIFSLVSIFTTRKR